MRGRFPELTFCKIAHPASRSVDASTVLADWSIMPRHQRFPRISIALAAAVLAIPVATAHADTDRLPVRSDEPSQTGIGLDLPVKSPYALWSTDKGASKVVFDGQHVWALEREAFRVTERHPITGTILREFSFHNPVDLATDGDYVWAIGYMASGSCLHRFDAHGGNSHLFWEAPTGAQHIEAGGGAVWVAQNALGDGELWRYDQDGELANVYTGMGHVSDLLFDDGLLWIARTVPGIQRFDPDLGLVTGTFSATGDASHVALESDGTHLWALSGGSEPKIALVAPATGQTLSVATTGPIAKDLVADATSVWSIHGGGELVRYGNNGDTVTIDEVHKTGFAPIDATFDGNNLWLAQDDASHYLVEYFG